MAPGEALRAVAGHAFLWWDDVRPRTAAVGGRWAAVGGGPQDAVAPGAWFAIPPPADVHRILRQSGAHGSICALGQQGMAHRFPFFGLVGGEPPAPPERARRLRLLAALLDRSGDRGGAPADLLEAARARLGAGAYEPVEWARDLRSGYAWPASRRARLLPLYPAPGADVKVPWELSRFQHLTGMALYACSLRGQAETRRADEVATEVVIQILDWIVANPPRLGINWRYPMEAALRAWNWMWALALVGGSQRLGPVLSGLIGRSLRAHGAMLYNYLRCSPELRNNHYLSYVVGVLGVAAWHAPSPWSRRVLVPCLRQLRREMAARVLADGASWERTSSYQRLVTEMHVWAAGLCLRLGQDTWERADGFGRLRLPAAADEADLAGQLFPPAYWQRLARMVDLVATLDGGSGAAPLFGDGDSGRLHKLTPTGRLVAPGGAFVEADGDYGPVVAAGRALLGLDAGGVAGGRYQLEAALLAGSDRRPGAPGLDRRAAALPRRALLPVRSSIRMPGRVAVTQAPEVGSAPRQADALAGPDRGLPPGPPRARMVLRLPAPLAPVRATRPEDAAPRPPSARSTRGSSCSPASAPPWWPATGCG